MRAKVLTLAIVTAIIALPVPASQLLGGPAGPAVMPGAAEVSVLLQDPFLIDALSYTPPVRLADADPHAR